MLILHVLPDLNTGGAELMMKRLVESHLGDPHYQHRVISLRSLGTVGPVLQSSGIEVEPLGLTSIWRLPLTLWRLARRMRSLKPDIVQTWMYHSDLLAGLAAYSAGHRRIIWGVRIADIGPELGVARLTSVIRLACSRLSARIPSRIVYVAESARIIHEQLGYDPSKSVVIQNGYRTSASLQPNAGQALRQELDIGSSDLVVGSAGRWNPQKDHRTFLKACERVAKALPQARFVLAGRGVDNGNIELRRWILDTGHPDRFHLLGERRDMDACFAAMDVFCLHSLQEGFPNVVGEAMSAGLPCVVTDAGDAALLVADTGLTVPPANAEALGGALVTMLQKERSERHMLGSLARARILGHFSMDAIRSKYERLYREVVERPPGEGADEQPEMAQQASKPQQQR